MKELPVYPGTTAPRSWRSLEELENTPEFQRGLAGVSSEQVLAQASALDRRDLFKFLGVSFALAGLTACTRQPEEKIVPYVRQPEEVVPGGRPLFFATAMTVAGSATGLLIESHQGRPTKAEGNPLHPASLGATDLFAQASLYGLYDPDRSQTLTYLEEIRPWPAFLGAMRLVVEAERLRKGAGLRILTEAVCSPTLAAQRAQLLAAFPAAKWVEWEPVCRDNARAGARLAFGQPVETIPDLSQAEVILSLGSDFLSCGPGHLRFARDFAERRRQLAQPPGAASAGTGNRLYVVESVPTVTGANADHRRPASSSGLENFARSLASAFGLTAGAMTKDPFLAALIAELKAHTGSSVVLVGDEQPPFVHVIGHAINAALGNFGKTVVAIDPVAADPSEQLPRLRELAADMDAGRVETLLMLGGNPVFDAPADLQFGQRLQKVRLRAHLSLHHDETSALCQWHVPQAHFLESWSDTRAFDGTVSIVQPLIAPLYGGKTDHDIVAALSDQPDRSTYELVRETWRARTMGDFEAEWRRSLHDGVVSGTAFAPKAVRPAGNAVEAALAAASEPGQAPLPRTDGGRAQAGFEILFRPDPNIYDGRFANNGWLHELSRPITRLTWDNAAIFSIAAASRLGVRKEDVVSISYRGRQLSAPVWVEPGIPEDCVLLHFGNGRQRAGQLGTRVGFDPYPLRFSGALWSGHGAVVEKSGGKWELASTQLQQNMAGRHPVRTASVEDFRRRPNFVHQDEEEREPGPEETLYPRYPSDTYAWAMAIDLNVCVGCNACELACQAENNIPIVGKDQVRRGRAMHWIRVDHYYDGDPENPQHFFQPVPCMHCETAPCELVCPVGATVHSAEGLNDMVYNRCVGTRYCSNNCPYKVRRFNFYHYALQFQAPSLKMLANPDVTVRWRGVMEKCTYCVQRIQRGKIDSELENRRVRDGEITPACAQACPTRAIVFGDLADAGSRVSRLRKDPRSYGLLAELGTRPRTTYLGALRNPNRELPGEETRRS